MEDTQIAWMDKEKFWEVMRETSVVRLNLSIEELEDVKKRLVEKDKRFENVELGWIKDFLDLQNSVFVAVKTYHERYEIGNRPVEKKKEATPPIPLNNKEWHKSNRLRPFASIDEKVKWHIDHVANCKCWPIPKYVKKEIEKRVK